MMRARPIKSVVRKFLPSTKVSKVKGITIPAISPYEASADFVILSPITINSRAIQPKKQPITDN